MSAGMSRCVRGMDGLSHELSRTKQPLVRTWLSSALSRNLTVNSFLTRERLQAHEPKFV